MHASAPSQPQQEWPCQTQGTHSLTVSVFSSYPSRNLSLLHPTPHHYPQAYLSGPVGQLRTIIEEVASDGPLARLSLMRPALWSAKLGSYIAAPQSMSTGNVRPYVNAPGNLQPSASALQPILPAYPDVYEKKAKNKKHHGKLLHNKNNKKPTKDDLTRRRFKGIFSSNVSKTVTDSLFDAATPGLDVFRPANSSAPAPSTG
ncbi:hypothetical protein FN846DRAFT_885686 [Sphaerosporella brunnea]|uniref:Uncharacterized protein n=1 Tax=Sphaerosporella brunnea TaxID=1250544 RepID=A0A5J5FCI5_9PEZI|nr:hypothetical protein FN846DRAFT_885686 [Sphaerosporella brunnea]